MTQINSQQYLYIQDEEDEATYAELKLVVLNGNIYAETLKGVLGGLNVQFDGIYKKQ